MYLFIYPIIYPCIHYPFINWSLTIFFQNAQSFEARVFRVLAQYLNFSIEFYQLNTTDRTHGSFDEIEQRWISLISDISKNKYASSDGTFHMSSHRMNSVVFSTSLHRTNSRLYVKHSDLRVSWLLFYRVSWNFLFSNLANILSDSINLLQFSLWFLKFFFSQLICLLLILFIFTEFPEVWWNNQGWKYSA